MQCRRGRWPSFVLPTTATSGFKSIKCSARLYASAVPIASHGKLAPMPCKPSLHLGQGKDQKPSRILHATPQPSTSPPLLISPEQLSITLISDKVAFLDRDKQQLQAIRSVLLACNPVADSNAHRLTTPQSVRAHPEATFDRRASATLTRLRTTSRRMHTAPTAFTARLYHEEFLNSSIHFRW